MLVFSDRFDLHHNLFERLSDEGDTWVHTTGVQQSCLNDSVVINEPPMFEYPAILLRD